MTAEQNYEKNSPVSIFYSFAQADELLQQQLEMHLSLLRQQRIIKEWHHRQIEPGTDWAQSIEANLMTTQVILLLISPDFLASDYCYSVEMKQALERQAAGTAIVIPILLRPVDWNTAPFRHLQCLPRNGIPVTTWNNHDEAWSKIVREIREIIKQHHLSPQSVYSDVSYSDRDLLLGPMQQAKSPLSVQDPNRQRMLERVQAIWIDGVLEQSLHGAKLLTLNLQEKPDALANPWRLIVQETDQPVQALPAGIQITQVYDKAEGKVLIMGEPGAGKTTLLLELTRHLIDRARKRPDERIPLILNLSSWAKEHSPLVDWLVKELQEKYEVPYRLGEVWVNKEQLILLLDGLDEVAPIDRDGCVQAINEYRKAYPSVPVVVCSRSTDYLNQHTQLQLRSAIIIQPITDQQVDDYIQSSGGQLEALRQALYQSHDLRELASVPLMLNVLTRVYQIARLNDLTAADSFQAKQHQILASYVQHMLQRRGIHTRYTAQQTIYWLTCLAHKMKQRSQTIFYIEHMQPDWLENPRLMQAYDLLAVRLPAILVGALVGWVLSALLLEIPMTPSINISLVIGGFIGGLLSKVNNDQEKNSTKTGFWRSTWFNRLLRGLKNGIFIGLLVGLSMSEGGFWGRNFQFVFGFSFGVSCFLLTLIFGERKPLKLSDKTTVVSSSKKWYHPIDLGYLKNGLVIGLLIGLSSGLSDGISSASFGEGYVLRIRLSAGLSNGLSSGLNAGLYFGLIGIILSIVLGKDDGAIHPAEIIIWSWNNFKKSISNIKYIVNGLLIGGLLTVCFSLVVKICFGLASGLDLGLDNYLGYGLLTGLSIGLTNELSTGMEVVLSNGLTVGLICWLLLGLFFGVSSQTLKEQHRTIPNEGMNRSARNGIQIGFISGLVSGFIGIMGGMLFYFLTGWWSDTLWHGLFNWVFYGLGIGMVYGLLATLFTGGLAYYRHSVLNLLLNRSKLIPQNYSDFLDYAAERVLLRKVGGGYIFIHHLLLDYFASLEDHPTN